ncbi:hypothetical protein A2U01_0025209, partial [Trifolium medium]|nr:hypothetical protein [Trifolium medium]
SGTVQNAADEDIQRPFKIQKLSNIPQDHIVDLNEQVLPSGVVSTENQGVNWTSLDKLVFEIELKAIKGLVRTVDNKKKEYLRKQSHPLEPFEIVHKHHIDDLLGRLKILKKTAAELKHFNGVTEISELIVKG